MRSGKGLIGSRIILIIVAFLIAISAFFTANSGTAEEVEATEKTEETEELWKNRQVLLSMGKTKETMYISWMGDEDGPRLLKYAEDKYSLPAVVPIRAEKITLFGGEYYRFKVKLTELEAGKEYWYEIGDGVVYDSPVSFCVGENDDEDVFAYLGDPQFEFSTKEYERWGALVSKMEDSQPDLEFALMGGDMVNIPSRRNQWSDFLDNCSSFSRLPVMAVPGNHEGVGSNNTYKKLFNHIGNGPDDEAFYWFDYGKCRFIMMDSSFLSGARKLAMGRDVWEAKEKAVELWLAKALEAGTQTWNIVVIHHPVYGLHDLQTESPEIRSRWVPIMKDGGVDLVLSGHQHVYMRTQKIDGITHIMGVSGVRRSNYYKGINEPVYCESIYSVGANYQVFKVTKKTIELKSYNENGNIIDAAVIKKEVKFPYSRISWWRSHIR